MDTINPHIIVIAYLQVQIKKEKQEGKEIGQRKRGGVEVTLAQTTNDCQQNFYQSQHILPQLPRREG